MSSALATRRSFVTVQQRIRPKRPFPWRQGPRQQHQCQHISLFSHAAFQDPTLVWAQSNPGLAQSCLNPPTLNNGPWYLNGKIESLEDYLKWRRWSYPKDIIGKSSNSSGDEKESANALISHVLSAPLTMADQFNHITKSCGKFPLNGGEAKLNWCCVGARAEASIPNVYWKEFLALSRASVLSTVEPSDGESSVERIRNLEVSIDFVGPDIPPKIVKRSVSVPDTQDDNHSPLASLSLRGYHRGFFHDIPALHTGASWDAYIFFNPGYGHPNLRESWESTLKLLLDQGEGNTHKQPRVMLVTAHSEKDAARDEKVLVSHYGLQGVDYRENPFASRITYEDPFEHQHFVRPNHYVATVLI